MRLALLLTSGMAVVLAAMLGLEVLEPWSPDAAADATGVIPANHVRVPSPAPAASSAPLMHGDEWVATILARPLFTRDRRPATANTTVAAADTGGPLPRLTGIAISPERRRAIFAGSDGAKPIVVEEGGTIAGFTVQAIGPEGIKVHGPDGERSVALAFDPNPPAVAANPDQVQPQLPNQPPGFPQPPMFGQPGQPGFPAYPQPFGQARPGIPVGPNGQPYLRQPFTRPRADAVGLHPDFRSS